MKKGQIQADPLDVAIADVVSQTVEKPWYFARDAAVGFAIGFIIQWFYLRHFFPALFGNPLIVVPIALIVAGIRRSRRVRQEARFDEASFRDWAIRTNAAFAHGRSQPSVADHDNESAVRPHSARNVFYPPAAAAMDPAVFRNWLVHVRGLIGWTTADLAIIAGVHEAIITGIEAGSIKKPDRHATNQIVAAFSGTLVRTYRSALEYHNDRENLNRLGWEGLASAQGKGGTFVVTYHHRMSHESCQPQTGSAKF